MRHDSGEKKKSGVKRSASGFKAGAIGSSVPKTKEKKMEDERDLLKIKIGMSDKAYRSIRVQLNA